MVQNMTSTECSDHCTIVKVCVNLGQALTQSEDMLQQLEMKPRVSISMGF